MLVDLSRPLALTFRQQQASTYRARATIGTTGSNPLQRVTRTTRAAAPDPDCAGARSREPAPVQRGQDGPPPEHQHGGPGAADHSGEAPLPKFSAARTTPAWPVAIALVQPVMRRLEQQVGFRGHRVHQQRRSAGVGCRVACGTVAAAARAPLSSTPASLGTRPQPTHPVDLAVGHRPVPGSRRPARSRRRRRRQRCPDDPRSRRHASAASPGRPLRRPGPRSEQATDDGRGRRAKSTAVRNGVVGTSRSPGAPHRVGRARPGLRR